MKYFWFRGFYLLVIFILGFNWGACSQNQIPDDFEYLSPLPFSKFVNTQQNIAFRFNNSIYPIELNQVEVLIKGSISDVINGKLKLADDDKTIVFKPDKPFVTNETIEVKIISPVYISKGSFLFYFSIGSLENSKREQIARELLIKRFPEFSKNQLNSSSVKKTSTSLKDSLPAGFPDISVIHSNNPSPGYIFIAPFSYNTGSLFNIILDNYGTPVYYKKTTNGAADFKVQPNGDITYYDFSAGKYYRMNSLYEIVDSINISNGFYADMHELRMLENGHYLLLGIDPHLVNMDTIFPGGHPQAIVVGLVVQELDTEKDVVFQWRSWDHFQITDASDYVSLTDSLIDYVHGNSIEIVSEASLLLSCRNMNEITNINRNTGEIIWRLGGKNNMFDMINFPDTFCMQHSIRLMPDSVNISLFDNGNCHYPEPYSSAVEYHISESTMTIEMLDQIRNEPDIFGEFMGNAQRLQNGNSIIGWGWGIPGVSEYNSEGNKLLEISFPHVNYRAFKFDWESNVFETNVEEIKFGHIGLQDSVFKSVEISNNCNYPIEINKFLTNKNVFLPATNLPITIQPNDAENIIIKFKADTIGTYNDLLTLCWDIETFTKVQRVARQVKLKGMVGYQGLSGNPNGQGLHVFPNPFKEAITIQSADHIIAEIKVYNHAGVLLAKTENVFSKNCTIYPGDTSGVYFVKMILVNGESCTTKIIRQ